jgi:hypothetical protein
VKAIVLERKGDWAAVLCEDGVVTKTRQKGEVGETIELETQVTTFTPRHSAWRRSLVAAAVAICILTGSFAYVTVPASASVSVTVGESEMEIGINRLGRVVSVNGINEDGKELAESLRPEMKGKKFDQAFEHAMDRFDERGMIDDDDEFVMVKVKGENERRDIELTEQIRVVRDGEHHRPIYFDGETPDIRKHEGERPEFNEGDRPEMPEMEQGERPQFNEGDRPEMPEMEQGERPEFNEGDRPEMPEMEQGERPQFNEGDRPEMPEMEQGERPQFNGGDRPEMPQQGGGEAPGANASQGPGPNGERPDNN